MKLKIAITTHNRYDVFKKSYDMWVKHLPKGAELIVVDDGSVVPVPEADFRFETAQGICVAKNKCFELMGSADFYFLADDDIYPLNKNWYQSLINSGVNHLCVGFDTFSNGGKNGHKILNTVGNLIYWEKPCGLLLMFTPICLEKAGGMDTRYKKWSGEHENLSQRIYNLGLTPHPFIDVKGSMKNFYSFDQHQSTERSVDPKLRNQLWAVNRQLLVRDINSQAFMPFKPLEDVYITTLFTKIVDPQRGTDWSGVGVDVLKDLVDSIQGKKLIVLTDFFEGTDGNTHFIKVETESSNPYWQRWLSIQKHLAENTYNKVFICDGTDVTVARNPFPHILPSKLYLGDEQGAIIHNKWLMSRHPAEIYQKMYKIGHGWRLLNAGLCGGYHNIVFSFVSRMVEHYRNYGFKDYTDMAGFNYIAYLVFKDHILHGKQVNNIFKSYADNGVCWFLHK